MGLEFLTDALGSIISGGITGIAGTALTMYGELKKQQELHRHDEVMSANELAVAQAEADRAIKISAQEADAQIQVQDSKTLAESYQADSRSYSTGLIVKMYEGGGFSKFLAGVLSLALGVVDIFRGLIRPSMTTYMTGLTTVIYIDILHLTQGIDGAVTKDSAIALLQQIILVILYLTSTCVLWWFGTRQKVIKP